LPKFNKLTIHTRGPWRENGLIEKKMYWYSREINMEISRRWQKTDQWPVTKICDYMFNILLNYNRHIFFIWLAVAEFKIYTERSTMKFQLDQNVNDFYTAIVSAMYAVKSMHFFGWLKLLTSIFSYYLEEITLK
jgi:hypothetical protein